MRGLPRILIGIRSAKDGKNMKLGKRIVAQQETYLKSFTAIRDPQDKEAVYGTTH